MKGCKVRDQQHVGEFKEKALLGFGDMELTRCRFDLCAKKYHFLFEGLSCSLCVDELLLLVASLAVVGTLVQLIEWIEHLELLWGGSLLLMNWAVLGVVSA